MKNKCYRQFVALLSILGLVLISGVVYAEKELTAEEIKKMIVGKTIDAEHLKKDYRFKAYHTEDGKILLKKDTGNEERRYEINDKNEHCVSTSASTKCAKIVDNGDGTYDRVLVKNGMHVIRWHKFSDGKTF